MYQRMEKSLIVAGSIFCLLAMTDFGHGQVGGELKSLCNDKRVSLTRISQVRQLIEDSNSTETAVSLCNKFRDSLNELDDILATVREGEICNLDLVDKIRNYHYSFIAKSKNKTPKAIPQALRYFFIALCFQISAKCKSVLINDLELDTQGVITESDFKEIEFLQKYGIKLFDNTTEIKDFDNILLLSELNSIEPNRDVDVEAYEKSQLFIKMRTTEEIRRLIRNCNNKFKPFYDKLIMPLVGLSNLGYNYEGELIEKELAELRRNKLVNRWYYIVQTCEAFGNVKILEDRDYSGLSEGRHLVTLLNKESAEYLHEHHVKTVDEELESENESLESERIVYNSQTKCKEDELWITNQEELDQLVANHQSSRTEIDRIKARISNQVLAKVKELIKSGNFLMVAQKFLKDGLSGHTVLQTDNIMEKFIMLLDKAMTNDAIINGEATREDFEMPVAGLHKDYYKKSSLPNDPRLLSSTGLLKALPERSQMAVKPKDGTKFTTKLSNTFDDLLPKKMDLVMSMLAIAGVLLLIIAIFGSG